MHMIHGYGGWSWMMIFMIINLVVLFSIGVYLIRYLVRGSKKQKKEPIDILNEQLVKGELNEEDYDRMKRKLKDK
ncbi:SHOCT domain-containing protein [Salipaludibacillus sp. CF4.18]|uniref:SHOCT domain-containing protein n=1 Tax=Salipaludibacillus sp. CF4.18 TaxID=3373081 RepID=UPI003EE73FB8